MARKAQLATGPAAYHARIEVEKITALEARIAELEERQACWISPFQLTAKIKETVHRTWAEAHKDGYRAGWSDKACGMVPHQYPPAPEVPDTIDMLCAADR